MEADLQGIGTHCDFTDCKKLDFLPYKWPKHIALNANHAPQISVKLTVSNLIIIVKLKLFLKGR
jgi:hypothetical protein